EPRPVVADDGQAVAPAKAKRRQAQGEVVHLVLVLAPGPRLPDPPVLLTDGRTVAEVARIALQQAGKRVRHGTPRSARTHFRIRSARLRLHLASLRPGKP